MKKTNVVLGVTGSIAAYKAAEIVRLCVTKGWNVSVIMTQCATRFVGELTFRTLSRNPVATDMFGEGVEWCPEHVALADLADVMLIAPCTANMIAKIAHGFADDLLSCAVLAAKGPVVVAPAMNDRMWDNAATQENLATIKSRGVHIVDVGTGELACGREGRGRMASVETIMKAVEQVLGESRTRKKRSSAD